MPARLTFKLEAREADGAVPFDAFAEMTAHAASLLAELDRARSGEPSIRWVVRDLARGSAVVEIEAVPVNPLYDVREPIAREFTSGLAQVAERRRRPEGFSDLAWDDTRALVIVLHDGVARLSIT